MPAFKNITGLRFGRWTALERGTRPLWLCRCDCGKDAFVRRRDLETGHSKSCGCLNRELSAARCVAHNATHGHRRTPTYRVWQKMRDRCNNPKQKGYARYGGRGIKDRYAGFAEFLAYMGEKPPGCELHRKDNDGDYEPGNCEWLPRSAHRRLHATRRTKYVPRLLDVPSPK